MVALMSPKSAAATADRYVNILLQQERTARALVPFADEYITGYIASALAGTTDPLPDTQLCRQIAVQGPQVWTEVSFVAQDAAVRRLWQQYRIVYDIDEDLWYELGDTELDTTIPATLFSYLPHPDPFIALPEPLLLPLGPRQRQRIDGFFVRGAADVHTGTGEPAGQIQVSTHAPNANPHLLGVLFLGTVETLDGKPVMVDRFTQDGIWTRVTLDTRAGHGTVQDMVDHTSHGFRAEALAGDWRRDVPRMVQRAVSLLVYLCAANADLQPVPRTKLGRARRSSDRSQSAKPLMVVGVGYRIGAALRAYRKSAPRPAGIPAGRTVPPHLRRAHFHTFLAGPGRTETRVHWLPPIPINIRGPAEHSTIIQVPPRTSRRR
jgi:hypothetical protein